MSGMRGRNIEDPPLPLPAEGGEENHRLNELNKRSYGKDRQQTKGEDATHD